MESLAKWRKLFEGEGTEICNLIDNLIENAIPVATSDCSTELSRKRDRIAQEGITGCHDKTSDRVNSSIGETDGIRIINHRSSYDEAKDLTEEIEDESQALKEVFKIRDILANSDTVVFLISYISDSFIESLLTSNIILIGDFSLAAIKHTLLLMQLIISVTELYECLRRLELMQLTVESLKETQIGKQVNQLRKHNSKEIQSMVKRLNRGWKDTVDEWVKTTENVVAAATAVTSPGSASPAMANDENGLPSPPLDEGAFLSTQMTSIEISQVVFRYV
eukprot:PITA_18097